MITSHSRKGLIGFPAERGTDCDRGVGQMLTAAGRPSDGINAVQSSVAKLSTSDTTEEIENTILKTL